MAGRVRVKFGEEWVEGEELDFEPLKETWNEYRCSDGSYVKLKVVVSKIIKLEKRNPLGEPVYQLSSANVLAVTPPAKDMQ
jgi:hypothetical protein